MTTNGKKVVRLDDLADPIAARIEVQGEQHDVLAFDGYDFDWLKDLTDDTPMPDIYAKVAKIIPTLAADGRHMMLGRRQLIAVIRLGAAGIEAVEGMFPNGSSPETPISPG